MNTKEAITAYRTRHSIARNAVGCINTANALIDLDRVVHERLQIEGGDSASAIDFLFDGDSEAHLFWEAVVDLEVAIKRLQEAMPNATHSGKEDTRG